MLLSLLCVVCALYLTARTFWHIYLYPRFFSPLRCIPGLRSASFLFGNLSQIWQRPHGEMIHEWAEGMKHDGIIRYLDIFNAERLVVLSPEALSEVLVAKQADFIKPPQLTKGLARILGNGLSLAEGDEHKRQRKDLMPAFTFRHVKDLYPVFLSKCCELTRALEACIQGNENHDHADIDVQSWASRATLDIIGLAGLGTDFGAILDPGNELYQTYQKIFAPGRRGQILGVLGFILPGWILNNLPIKLNADMISASSVIKSQCLSLISSKSCKASDCKPASNDIISLALASGSFTHEMLTEQIMTFLLAGHETTSSALSWAIYALCQYPGVQGRLRKELNAEVPGISTSVTVTAEQIDKLQYLHAVCREVLRLWPPVPMTTRVAARDTQLLQYSIKKGTVIMICPLAANRSRESWGRDALEFNPDRWIQEQAPKRSNFAMLTFLEGPRNCIGSGFAKAEFACLLASWVSTFETSFADSDYVMKVSNGITARPADLKVRLKRVGLV